MPTTKIYKYFKKNWQESPVINNNSYFLKCLNSSRRFSVWGFNRTTNDCFACCDSCRRCLLCVTRCRYWLSSNWSAGSEEQSVLTQLPQVILDCHRMTWLLPVLWNKTDTLTMFDWLQCESRSHPQTWRKGTVSVSYHSEAVTTHLTKAGWRRQGQFYATVSYGGDVMVERVEITLETVRKQGEVKAGAQLPSSFLSAQDFNPSSMPPTLRVVTFYHNLEMVSKAFLEVCLLKDFTSCQVDKWGHLMVHIL